MFVWIVIRYLLITASSLHSAALTCLPTKAEQGSQPGQNLNGRPQGNTRLLLEEFIERPVGGTHPVLRVGPRAPV